MVLMLRGMQYTKPHVPIVGIPTFQNKYWVEVLLVNSSAASLRGNTLKNSSLIAGSPNVKSRGISSQAL